jgi:aspartate oxidase
MSKHNVNKNSKKILYDDVLRSESYLIHDAKRDAIHGATHDATHETQPKKKVVTLIKNHETKHQKLAYYDYMRQKKSELKKEFPSYTPSQLQKMAQEAYRDYKISI